MEKQIPSFSDISLARDTFLREMSSQIGPINSEIESLQQKADEYTKLIVNMQNELSKDR